MTGRPRHRDCPIATHFTELFERHLWRAFAEEVVAVALGHALRQEAAAFVAEQAAGTIPYSILPDDHLADAAAEPSKIGRPASALLWG